MVSASEYATLANAAYARDDNALALRKIQEDSNGRFQSSDYEVLEGDKDYKVFKKISTGEVIIACRGTSGADDANPDLFIAAGALPLHDRSRKITEVTRKYRKSHNNVTITGHSLGGALAAAAAVRTDTMAVTFNQGSSPVDTIVQGVGSVLGYRYKNIVHFAVCNDIVSTSACLVDNVTNIKIPTASSSVLASLKNHRLGQFLLLNDDKYATVLKSTSSLVQKHQETNPDEINGPSHPVSDIIGKTSGIYASYKAFLAGIDKAIEKLQGLNNPQLNSQLNNIRSAVDDIRGMEENVRNAGIEMQDSARRAALERLQDVASDLSQRVRRIVNGMPAEERALIIEDIGSVFTEPELTNAINDIHGVWRDDPEFFDFSSEESKELESALDALDDDIAADLVDEAVLPNDPIAPDDVIEFPEPGIDAAEIEEVGEFVAASEGAASVLSSAGPLLAGVLAVAGIAAGIYSQVKMQETRNRIRNEIIKNRQNYAQQFHSYTNKLSTFTKKPKLSQFKSFHEVAQPRTTLNPNTSSEYDYYGPDALRYLKWRVDNPDIVGPTNDILQGIGSAYRTLISPGMLWVEPHYTSLGNEYQLVHEADERKRSMGISQGLSSRTVITYINAYEWLLKDNARLNGTTYRQRISDLMKKHTRHKFGDLTEGAQTSWLDQAGEQLQYNPELLKLFNQGRNIVQTITKMTSGTKNMSSFVSAAKQLYSDLAREMTVDFSTDGDRDHAAKFLKRNIVAFVRGVHALANDDLMFRAFALGGADMNSYQVYVSIGIRNRMSEWHTTLIGSNEKAAKLREWLKDDTWSVDAYISAGYPSKGDWETEDEFVDRYTRWVSDSATFWEWMQHQAAVNVYPVPQTQQQGTTVCVRPSKRTKVQPPQQQSLPLPPPIVASTS